MAVQSFMVPLGTPAPDFALPDLAGTTVRRDDLASPPALLVFFACNHCPYVRHVEGELGKVLAGYPDLAVVAICPNDAQAYPEDRPEHLRNDGETPGAREGRELRERMHAVLAKGMSPDEVAGKLVAAIRSDARYLLTDHEWDERIIARHRALLAGAAR